MRTGFLALYWERDNAKIVSCLPPPSGSLYQTSFFYYLTLPFVFLLFFGHDCACGWLYLSACVCQWEACGVDRLCRRTCHCHRHSLHADRYHHNDSVINETIQKENKARQGKLSQVRTDSVADIDNYHLADSVDDDVLSLSQTPSLLLSSLNLFLFLSVALHCLTRCYEFQSVSCPCHVRVRITSHRIVGMNWTQWDH